MKNKIQKINKKDSQLVNLESQLDLLLKGQENNSDKLQIIGEELRRGFIGLALRNEELLKSNDQLKQQLDEVLKELNAIKQERQEKAARKEAWTTRKRKPKRDPIDSKIYQLLIQETAGPGYVDTRTRVAICLLTITGVRISELLPLKVHQLQTLLKEGWVPISRLKRGPSNHKAFLTHSGKKILKAREKDFQALFFGKQPEDYVFTSNRNPHKMLQRQTLTTDVNRVTKVVSQGLPGKPVITSHSFRIGFITKLWKKTNDIEFVRQTIGHRDLSSTSKYISELPDQERKNKIEQIH